MVDVTHVYAVAIHLQEGGTATFPSLAHAIAFLIARQPISYTLDVIEPVGDHHAVYRLVSIEQSALALRDLAHLFAANKAHPDVIPFPYDRIKP